MIKIKFVLIILLIVVSILIIFSSSDAPEETILEDPVEFVGVQDLSTGEITEFTIKVNSTEAQKIEGEIKAQW